MPVPLQPFFDHRHDSASAAGGDERFGPVSAEAVAPPASPDDGAVVDGAVVSTRGWIALAAEIVFGSIGIALGLGLVMVLLAMVAQPARAAAVEATRPAAAAPKGAESAAPAGRAAAPLAHGGAIARIETDRAAGLILHAGNGPIAAPLVASDARITVTGPVLRAHVIQRFVNPRGLGLATATSTAGPRTEATDDPFIEATYLFPLGDGAAVDHLTLTIGERRVEGRIVERGLARATYDRAREAGRPTALLEAERPNAFKTRVANIAPGETITVEIEYQQTLAPSNGAWQLRFPTVVAPRYSRDPSGGELAQAYVRPPSPAGSLPSPDGSSSSSNGSLSSSDGWQVASHRVATDVAPGSAVAIGPASYRLSVSVDPGFAVAAPRSATHRVSARLREPTAGPARGWQVDLAQPEPGDRDFVLEWQSQPAPMPRASLRLETRAGATYGLLVVDPPLSVAPTAIAGAEDAPLARETTFVIDTSGSMGGSSIDQARQALLFALERLRPGDAFNLIEFNSHHASLFAAAVPVDPRTLERARQWVRKLSARGGTEMRGAVSQALSAPLAAGRLGQVVLITDGAVDYEEQLVAQIEREIGDRRLFTVAIGSAPNSWFLRRLAEIGGGTLTQIGRIAEVERRMAALFSRLAQPASTDLALAVEGATLLDPPRLPRDLYAGEPLVALLRLSGPPAQVRLSGRQGQPWQLAVDVADAGSTATTAAGLHVLWARDAIEALGDRLRRLPADGDEARNLRREATALAIDHHLVTRYTSLVAVDPTTVRERSTPLASAAVPVAWPDGWTLPQTATPAGLELLLGMLLLAAGFVVLVHRRAARAIADILNGTRP
ncbi:MAG: marine proteobacterial sortase target protein [Burkholderiaceae bacterium]